MAATDIDRLKEQQAKLMPGAVWHYLDVAKAIDESTCRPSRIKIVLASLEVVVLGGASLPWLLW